MPLANKISVRELQEIIKLSELGYSQRYIARRFNLATSTVHYHLKKHNAKRGIQHQIRISHQEIVETIFMYQYCKLEPDEIAGIMNISVSAVRYRLTRHGGVTLRAKPIKAKDRPQIDLSPLQAKYMAKEGVY